MLQLVLGHSLFFVFWQWIRSLAPVFILHARLFIVFTTYLFVHGVRCV